MSGLAKHIAFYSSLHSYILYFTKFEENMACEIHILKFLNSCFQVYLIAGFRLVSVACSTSPGLILHNL